MEACYTAGDRAGSATGTTATLWLPIAARPVRGNDTPKPSASAGRSAIILVVDDDPLIAASTVDMLEGLCHTVVAADSAKRALEILAQGQFIDLMITDQAMPGMTGSDLATAVRMRWPDLPILLATGYADLSVGHETPLPRLSKPYEQAQLREQVDRLLTGRKQARRDSGQSAMNLPTDAQGVKVSGSGG
jgi:CheY-like chemotaxis protein